MSMWRWLLLVWGLLGGLVLLIGWLTSPTHCTAPDRHGIVRCQR